MDNRFPAYNVYNKDVKYPISYRKNNVNSEDFITMKIMVNETEGFPFKVVDYFPNKEPPKTFRTKAGLIDYIKNSTMNNWDNQFKFVFYYSTGAGGVSYHDHINHNNPMIRAIFRFHVYYTMRKLFHQLKIPLPGNADFNKNNNSFDKQEYERLKLDFDNVNVIYMNDPKTNIIVHSKNLNIPMQIPSPKIKRYQQNYVFDWSKPRVSMFQSDVISMRLKESDDWTSLIPMYGKGLTAVGIQRLNESIRTYVYCILGAQVMIGADIMNLDVQKQFVTFVEDAISGTRLVDSIRNFQSTLVKTGSKLDYAIGPNVQKLPSDMILKFGNTVVTNEPIKMKKDDEPIEMKKDDKPTETTNHMPMTSVLLLAITLFELFF